MASTRESEQPIAEGVSYQQSTETAHEHTLFAEPLFHLGRLTVTNSLLTSALVSVAIIAGAWLVGRNIKRIPRGAQNLLEMLIDGALDFIDTITGSRERSQKFFPWAFCFFLFILANNWAGLLPGVGTVGWNLSEHGTYTFVPLLRGGTADLNTTLALAIIAVVITHIFGVASLGAWHHLNKYINISAIASIPKKIWRDPLVILVGPIKAFVGIIEIIGELAKVISLSLRLFGNVFAGEVLLASMAALVAYAVPIPFLFFEILVGVIQAFVFSLLFLVFLHLSTMEEQHA